MAGGGTFRGRCASRRISLALESRVFRKLQMIDDTITHHDLRVLPSNHLEKSALASLRHSIRSTSTSNGGLYFDWTAARMKQAMCI